MAEENCDWIFVNMVPMLCEKVRIVKQQKVETWLNLSQLAAQLGLQKKSSHADRQSLSYVV